MRFLSKLGRGVLVPARMCFWKEARAVGWPWGWANRRALGSVCAFALCLGTLLAAPAHAARLEMVAICVTKPSGHQVTRQVRADAVDRWLARGTTLGPCAPAPGSLTVAKTASGDGILPAGDFDFEFECDDPSSITGSVQVGIGESEVLASEVPAGTTCTVQEVSGRGADATTIAVSPADARVSEATRTVTVAVASATPVVVTFDNRYDAPVAEVPSALILTPEADTNLVGTNHTLTALVMNQFRQPVAAGQNVQFDVYRPPGARPILSTTVATDAQGQAVFTYAGPPTEADDTIVACIETSDVDTSCSAGDPIVDTAFKQWFSTPGAVTNTPPNSCVRFADTTNDFVDVEAPADGVNHRFPYDDGDQFNVDGVPTTITDFGLAVTHGDRIQVNFVPGGVSVFTLTNDTDCTP